MNGNVILKTQDQGGPHNVLDCLMKVYPGRLRLIKDRIEIQPGLQQSIANGLYWNRPSKNISTSAYNHLMTKQSGHWQNWPGQFCINSIISNFWIEPGSTIATSTSRASYDSSSYPIDHVRWILRSFVRENVMLFGCTATKPPTRLHTEKPGATIELTSVSPVRWVWKTRFHQ